SPSSTSRTTPMKLATPPMRGLPRRSAAISAPASKSSAWILTVTLAARHRRGKSDLVALHDLAIAPPPHLVDPRPHPLSRREFPRPRAAAGNEQCPQALHIAYFRGQLHLLGPFSERLAQAREIEDGDHDSMIRRG